MKIGQEIETLREEKYWQHGDGIRWPPSLKTKDDDDNDDDDRIETVETDFAWSLKEVKGQTRKN